MTFIRTGDDLTLLMGSTNWKLERGEQYPVTMKLGPQSWDREVAAEANAVSMEIEDAKFVSGLRAANTLNIVAMRTVLPISEGWSGPWTGMAYAGKC